LAKGAIQVDDVEPFSALTLPIFCSGAGIIAVHRLALGITLSQTDNVSCPEIDRWENDKTIRLCIHPFAFIILHV
jgi:hypothetical protein